MKRTLFLLAFASAASSISSGCKETVVTAAPGNIVGNVQLFDTLGQALDDQSGVTVSLPGSSLSAQSDLSGKWNIQNVPPGIYSIYFSKDNFSSWKEWNIQFVGNGTYYFY